MELTPDQLATLYAERSSIEAWLEPTPAEKERAEWIKKAKARKAEIDKLLAPHFFPKPKEEGTQRKKKDGFAAMLKTGYDRKVDETAVDDVCSRCPEGTKEEVLNYKPSVILKAYRALPDEVRTQFDACLKITPTTPEFEITKLED